MEALDKLTTSLNGYLNWNKARITCLANMLLAMIAVKTVNLREIAVAFQGDALCDSRYKRLCRFFANFNMNFETVARWVFSLYFSKEDKIYLTIDRTNWYWGKSKINVLTRRENSFRAEDISSSVIFSCFSFFENSTPLIVQGPNPAK